MNLLEKRLEALWKNQLPFVVFRLPNADEVTLFFQEDEQLHFTSDFSESGFVMTPFVAASDSPFIPNSKVESFSKPISKNQSESTISFSNDEKSKQHFIEIVKAAKHEIKKNTLKKVVLSRPIDLQSKKMPPVLFLDLENEYSNALTYLWHHPLVGTWLGATPEQFVETSDAETHTMALAGTQVYSRDKKPHWSSKEIEEQALVTQQVFLDLKTLFKESEIHFGEAIDKRAGNLVHLCTHFSLPKLNKSLKNLVTALHPTPAVGGVSKREAVNFILNNEGYDRSFYTGFLGILKDNRANLFVNLRCAEWTSDKIRLFVGAGITLSSDPESEWTETQRKAETFARIL